MNKRIEISNLSVEKLPILSDEEVRLNNNKGWTFSNVYYLRELRDIYLAIPLVLEKNLKSISEFVETSIEYDSTSWKERRVLEYLNALVNFGLIHQDYSIKKIAFIGSQINSPLSESDKACFKNIFLSYFRFMEISSWFLGPDKTIHSNFKNISIEQLIANSKPIYFLSDINRFTDTFLFSVDTVEKKYIIEDTMSHLMRFWDVYLKWGTTLGMIDKFNLSRMGIKTDNDREISMAYFIKPFKSFDFLTFLQAHFKSRSIPIPELIFLIAKEYRYSVNEIKEFLVNEIRINDKLTYERTSEIFIVKGKTKVKNISEATYLYPTLNDNYISHLIIRK